MKHSQRCPKCACRKLFVVETVRIPDPRYVNSTQTMTVASANLPSGKHGIFESGDARFEAGTFEAWVCSQCGLTEWYARDANQVLAYMAQHPDAKVHYVDGDAGRGPHR